MNKLRIKIDNDLRYTQVLTTLLKNYANVAENATGFPGTSYFIPFILTCNESTDGDTIVDIVYIEDLSREQAQQFGLYVFDETMITDAKNEWIFDNDRVSLPLDHPLIKGAKEFDAHLIRIKKHKE